MSDGRLNDSWDQLNEGRRGIPSSEPSLARDLGRAEHARRQEAESTQSSELYSPSLGGSA